MKFVDERSVINLTDLGERRWVDLDVLIADFKQNAKEIKAAEKNIVLETEGDVDLLLNIFEKEDDRKNGMIEIICKLFRINPEEI